MISRIERFASFNETWTAFSVNGKNVTLKDVGRWDIHVKVRYESAPFQTFEGLFRLYILMPGEDPPVSHDEEPDWVEAQERAAILAQVDTISEFTGSIITEFPEKTERSPIPYIVEVTPLGLVKIAWDKPMNPISAPQEKIPTAKIAVDFDLFTNKLRRQRQLRQDAWLDQHHMRVIILDALEVQIFRDLQGERIELEKFEWDVIDYTKDLLQLQLVIEDPEEIGSSQLY